MDEKAKELSKVLKEAVALLQENRQDIERCSPSEQFVKRMKHILSRLVNRLLVELGTYDDQQSTTSSNPNIFLPP